MPRIAVVGAGIAGLTAALTLRDAGLACDLYEAAHRVGGRMHSDASTWADGLVSEWCGEFIGSDHTTMHALITRFGLDTIALDRSGPGQAPSLMYLLGRFCDAEELAHGFEALVPILQQQMWEAGYPTTYARFTEAGRQLDQLSAYDWIERYVAGGHTTPLGHYLDGACTGLYGLDTSEQSALNLVYLFGAHDPVERTLAGSDARSTSASRPLLGNSKIAGGNVRLPLAMAAALPEEAIHLDHRLVALERAGDAALTLTFATAGGSVRARCEYTILALPFSTLRSVDYARAGFDDLKRAAIEQLGYGTISKLMLQFDQPYWYEDGPWPRSHSGFFITDLEMQTLWDASLGQAGASGLLVDYTSGHRGAAYAPLAPYTATDASAPDASAPDASAPDASAPDAAASVQFYAQRCLEQLERVFPGISAHYTGRAALSYPTGDPNLRGSYACWRVGQYTRFAGYEGVRQGPVLFAGEHCSLDFQGYMEGAAREGARAAAELVRELLP